MLQAKPENPPTISRALYTVADCAYILSLSQSKVRSLLRSRELKSIKIGDTYRVKEADLHAWLEEKSRE